MKKAILFCILLGTISTVNAQNCQPDNNISEPGIYPEYIDTGNVGSSYRHVFQILALKDTTVKFGPNTITATVDSVVVHSISGLPSSFNYLCEPPRCVFTWEAVGCIAVVGNPDESEKGVHPLEIQLTYYADLGSATVPVRDTIEDFVLVIEDSSMTSSIELAELENGIELGPNPSSNGIFKYSSEKVLHKIVVTDYQGRLIEEINETSVQGTIDLSQNSPGSYMIRFHTDTGVFVRRVLR
ncbi:T9SS type A sorting domain-containing protein [bacterium]|nr:T9SS type A sorting domain-containing protein [bacterium]